MADWEIIKIPRYGYGATKDYKWQHFLIQKGIESNEGWYIKNVKTGKEYNQVADFLENLRIQGGERRNNIHLWKSMLYEIAISHEDAWKKAKKPVWSHWTGTEIPPSDDTAVSNALFKNGRADYGFKRVKDAKKVAEWIALWETFQHGFGILNHSDSHMNIFYQL